MTKREALEGSVLLNASIGDRWRLGFAYGWSTEDAD